MKARVKKLKYSRFSSALAFAALAGRASPCQISWSNASFNNYATLFIQGTSASEISSDLNGVLDYSNDNGCPTLEYRSYGMAAPGLSTRNNLLFTKTGWNGMQTPVLFTLEGGGTVYRAVGVVFYWTSHDGKDHAGVPCNAFCADQDKANSCMPLSYSTATSNYYVGNHNIVQLPGMCLESGQAECNFQSLTPAATSFNIQTGLAVYDSAPQGDIVVTYKNGESCTVSPTGTPCSQAATQTIPNWVTHIQTGVWTSVSFAPNPNVDFTCLAEIQVHLSSVVLHNEGLNEPTIRFTRRSSDFFFEVDPQFSTGGVVDMTFKHGFSSVQPDFKAIYCQIQLPTIDPIFMTFYNPDAMGRTITLPRLQDIDPACNGIYTYNLSGTLGGQNVDEQASVGSLLYSDSSMDVTVSVENLNQLPKGQEFTLPYSVSLGGSVLQAVDLVFKMDSCEPTSDPSSDTHIYDSLSGADGTKNWPAFTQPDAWCGTYNIDKYYVECTSTQEGTGEACTISWLDNTVVDQDSLCACSWVNVNTDLLERAIIPNGLSWVNTYQFNVYGYDSVNFNVPDTPQWTLDLTVQTGYNCQVKQTIVQTAPLPSVPTLNYYYKTINDVLTFDNPALVPNDTDEECLGWSYTYELVYRTAWDQPWINTEDSANGISFLTASTLTNGQSKITLSTTENQYVVNWDEYANGCWQYDFKLVFTYVHTLDGQWPRITDESDIFRISFHPDCDSINTNSQVVSATSLTVYDESDALGPYSIAQRLNTGDQALCLEDINSLFIKFPESGKMYRPVASCSAEKKQVHPVEICPVSEDDTYNFRLQYYAVDNLMAQVGGCTNTLPDQTCQTTFQIHYSINAQPWDEWHSDGIMFYGSVDWEYTSEPTRQGCALENLRATSPASEEIKVINLGDTLDIAIGPWLYDAESCTVDITYDLTVYQIENPLAFQAFSSETVGQQSSLQPDLAVFSADKMKLRIKPLSEELVGLSFVAYVTARVLDYETVGYIYEPTEPIVFQVQEPPQEVAVDSGAPVLLDFVNSIEAVVGETTSVSLGTVSYAETAQVVIDRFDLLDTTFRNYVHPLAQTFVNQTKIEVEVTPTIELAGKETFLTLSLRGDYLDAPLRDYSVKVSILGVDGVEEADKNTSAETEDQESTTPSTSVSEDQDIEGQQPIFAPVTFTPVFPERNKTVVIDIQSPDEGGKMNFAFSREVRMPANATDWSSENEGNRVIEIAYKPTKETLDEVASFAKVIDFKWRVFSIKGVALNETLSMDPNRRRLKSETVPESDLQTFSDIDELELQLDFSEPLYVSQGRQSMDKLSVTVNPEVFHFDGSSVEYRTKVDGQETDSIQVSVPRQLTTSQMQLLEQVMEVAETSVTLLASSNVGLSFVFSSLIQFLWGLVNTLQMSMLTSLFSIMLPTNAQTMMFSMMRMSNLDIMQVEKLQRGIFQFEETQPFNAIFEFAGYETTNFIIETGTLLFLIMALFLYVPLRKLLQVSTSRLSLNFITKRLRQPLNLSAMTLRFLLEGCLGLGLVGAICLLSFEKFTFNTFLAILLLTVLLLTPLFVFLAAKQVSKVAEIRYAEEQSKEKALTAESKHAKLFTNLRHKSTAALSFNVVFMLRRFFVTTALSVLVNYPNMQVSIYLLASLLSFEFMSLVNPYDSTSLNRIEQTNECFILIVAYHMFFFTDYVVDLETQFGLGWSLVLVILANLLFNLIVFFGALYQQVKLSCKRSKARRAAKRAHKRLMARKLILDQIQADKEQARGFVLDSGLEGQGQGQVDQNQVSLVVVKAAGAQKKAIIKPMLLARNDSDSKPKVSAFSVASLQIKAKSDSLNLPGLAEPTSHPSNPYEDWINMPLQKASAAPLPAGLLRSQSDPEPLSVQISPDYQNPYSSPLLMQPNPHLRQSTGIQSQSEQGDEQYGFSKFRAVSQSESSGDQLAQSMQLKPSMSFALPVKTQTLGNGSEDDGNLHWD